MKTLGNIVKKLLCLLIIFMLGIALTVSCAEAKQDKNLKSKSGHNGNGKGSGHGFEERDLSKSCLPYGDIIRGQASSDADAWIDLVFLSPILGNYFESGSASGWHIDGPIEIQIYNGPDCVSLKEEGMSYFPDGINLDSNGRILTNINIRQDVMDQINSHTVDCMTMDIVVKQGDSVLGKRKLGLWEAKPIELNSVKVMGKTLDITLDDGQRQDNFPITPNYEFQNACYILIKDNGQVIWQSPYFVPLFDNNGLFQYPSVEVTDAYGAVELEVWDLEVGRNAIWENRRVDGETAYIKGKPRK